MEFTNYSNLPIKKFISNFVNMLLTAGILISQTSTALASSLYISPVRIFFEQGRNITSIDIQNKGVEPMLVQAEQVTWHQVNNEEMYEATDDLIVSPPIFEVQPGKTQTVRIGLKQKPDLTREKTYRLFLTEVPVARAQQPDSGSALSVSLRFALPIFVASNDAESLLKYNLRQQCSDGKWAFQVRNEGSKHDRILGYELFDTKTDTKIGRPGTMRYILAKSQVQWDLGGLAVDPSTQIKARLKFYPAREEEVVLAPQSGLCEETELAQIE